MLESVLKQGESGDAAEKAILLAGERARGLIESRTETVYLGGGLFAGHLHIESAREPEELYAAGVTSWTLGVYAKSVAGVEREALKAAASRLAAGAGFAGLYIEGPFIDGGEGGEVEDLLSVLDGLGGKVSSVVFAPECVEAAGFLEELSRRGIEGVVGYTSADFDVCAKAFESGAAGLCLPFVSTPPLFHRGPGAIGAGGAAGAWGEAALGLEDFTVQEARFIAKMFRGGARPVWHPGRHEEGGLRGGFPLDFARRAAGMLGAGAREFVETYANGAGGEGSFAFFDEELGVVATVVEGELAYERGEGG